MPRRANAKGSLHGFSTIEEGNQAFRYGNSEDEVVRNRKQFVSQFKGIGLQRGVSLRVSSAEQGKEVVCIGETFSDVGIQSPKKGVPAEALITQRTDIFLFLLTGDCLPIILFDPVTRSLALVHISRELTAQGLMGRVIDEMKSMFDVKPQDIQVGIGPAIHKESYKL